MIYINQNGELNSYVAASLVKLFSESKDSLKRRRISPEVLWDYKSILSDLLTKIPNSLTFCANVCENNEIKMSNLQANLRE